MNLAELQDAFQAHVFASDSRIAGEIPDGAKRGLPVYHHAYRATLRESLADTFAMTRRWLGHHSFDTVADLYVQNARSVSWTLANYGNGFPRFLGKSFPDNHALAELAWLERALRDAFGASPPSEEPFDLAMIDWDRAQLRFGRAVAARTVDHDLPAIWRSLAAEEEPIGAWKAEPLGLIVWRDGLSARFRSADPAEALLIEAIIGGEPFAAACARLNNVDADVAGQWVAGWFQSGMIDVVDDDHAD